jgi:hypothetical protein
MAVPTAKLESLLESVFKARAAERGHTPPVYITAPPPAAPRPPVEPMAVPTAKLESLTPPPSPMELPAARLSPLPPAPVCIAFGADGHRDADGLPWDGRIHSSSKALLVDGKWRQRRNTDPAVVAAVTAELRAALGAPAPAAAAVVVPSPVTVAPFVPENIPLPAALVVVPPPPPPADATLSFPDFMRAITAARIPPGTVLDACKAVGMPSIPALNQRPDLIPTVAAALGVA